MEGTTRTATRGYALNVCEMCRKRKRRCDKRLPQCSLCASFKSRTCRYSDSVDPTSTETSWDIAQPHDLSQKTVFPSVFFLDHGVFQQSLVEIPDPSTTLSQQILKLLIDDSHVRIVASQFFDVIHAFMPIISKKLFYGRHLNPLTTPRTDVLLLCLCMKIFKWTPLENNGDPRCQDYLSAKHCILEVEAAGIFTLQVLQAHILIAIYELGHGIYPSAYLSLGACVTHGIALDLEKELIHCEASRFTWVEQEERRRVWWAIIILERIANLGWPSRKLMTRDPVSEDLLPVDDSAWDTGIATQNHSINLMTTVDTDMGRYSRLALATHLLCRVYRHKEEHFSDLSVQAEYSLQLDRTLYAAITLCDLEGKRRGFSCCSPVDICQNALLILHTLPGNSKSALCYDESEAHDLAVSRGVAENTAARSKVFLESGHGALKEVSPIVLHSPYQAATVYIRLNHENPSKESSQALETLKHALKVKNRKWRVAGAYLHILDALEVM